MSKTLENLQEMAAAEIERLKENLARAARTRAEAGSEKA